MTKLHVVLKCAWPGQVVVSSRSPGPISQLCTQNSQVTLRAREANHAKKYENFCFLVNCAKFCTKEIPRYMHETHLSCLTGKKLQAPMGINAIFKELGGQSGLLSVLPTVKKDRVHSFQLTRKGVTSA